MLFAVISVKIHLFDFAHQRITRICSCTLVVKRLFYHVIQCVKEVFLINAVLFATQGEVVNEQERLVRYCESCPDRPVKTLIVPAVDEFVKTDSPSHPSPRNSIREVKIEDLLGRDEITINREEVHRAFSGKVVMVTGGAGSIGSELCRQIAGAVARRIVTYAKEGEECYIDEHLGFIKLGSRVDVYLPIGSEVCVKMGQATTGDLTVIAKLKKQGC